MLITCLFIGAFIASLALCYKLRNRDISLLLLLITTLCGVGLIVCGAMCACTPFEPEERTPEAMQKEYQLLELRVNDDYWQDDARLTAELVKDVDYYNELATEMRNTYLSPWTSWFGRSWMADLPLIDFPEGEWK